jgi:hypothetical protein
MKVPSFFPLSRLTERLTVYGYAVLAADCQQEERGMRLA